MDKERKTVFVTGFGPFGKHKVNDSWLAVNQLCNSNLESKLGIVLHSAEIQVTYKCAETSVNDIWNKYNPELVIHVGVHNDDSVMLEKQARRSGYCKEDVSMCIVDNNCCPIDSGELISTEIDIDRLIENIKRDDISIEKSTDAGNYLCEYTYYMSLCHNKARSLFVHIPPATSLIPLEKKVEVLEDIINVLCTQLQ